MALMRRDIFQELYQEGPMISIQKMIFPGIAAGCLFMVFVVSLIANPTIALAAGSGVRIEQPIAVKEQSQASALGQEKPVVEQAAAPAESIPAQTENKPGSCSLGQSYPDSVQQWCAFHRAVCWQQQPGPKPAGGCDASGVRRESAGIFKEWGGGPDASDASGRIGIRFYVYQRPLFCFSALNAGIIRS